MYPGIQALRFFAAAAVLVYHGAYYASTFGVIPSGVGPSLTVLARGVTVFFVLSGYLMAMLMERSTPGRFLVHRTLRIYPAFWLVLILAILKNLVFYGKIPEGNYIAEALLFPSTRTVFILGVEWTLFYEMFFYAVIALLCFIPSSGIRKSLILLWLAMVVHVNFIHPMGWVKDGSHPSITEIPFSSLNIMFIAGMLLWWLRPRRDIGAWRLLPLGIVLLLAGEHYEASKWVLANTLFIVGACILILAATSTGATHFFGRWRGLAMLGDGSYGVYLLHVTLFTSIFPFAGIQGWPFFLAVVLGTLALGVGFGVMEYRMYAFNSRWFEKSRRKKQPAVNEFNRSSRENFV